ncbi:MAG: hypothetical protein RBU21_10335 [FCB group bacterium]|nr:hypothetical protein [FCB group bacterium]
MRNGEVITATREKIPAFLWRQLVKGLLFLLAFYLLLHWVFGPPGAKKGIFWGGVTSEQEYWRLLEEHHDKE